MQRTTIALLLALTLPMHALGDNACPDIPASQLDLKFIEQTAEEVRVRQNLLAFDMPQKYEGAAFDRLEAVYRNQAGLTYRFPVAVHLPEPPDKFEFEIWLPADYRELELVATFRDASCARLLRAKFVGFERVE